MLIGLSVSFSPGDDAAARASDEVDDVAYLGSHFHFGLNLVEGVGCVQAALVDEAVGIVDGLDGLVGEAAAAQAHNVQSGVADGLASGDDIGRDVLAEAASALDHAISAHAAELMHQHVGTDDGVVVDDNLAGHLGGVADDAAVAYQGIVGHVYAFHQQVVVAHDGASFGSCAAVHGHVLTDEVVVANLGGRILALELQVLRDGTDDGTGKDGVAVADAAAVQDAGMGHNLVVVADDHILVDEDERRDFHVFAYLRFGMDVC